MGEHSLPKLLHRLRRRRVVQWSIGYVAGAWIVLEAAEMLFGIFGWPEVWLRRLTILLAFGFAAALVVAWYHGEKGQQRASAPELAILLVIGLGAAWTLATGGLGTRLPAATTTVNQFAGGNNRRLTANDFYVSGPAWSPDSLSLVYTSEEAGNRDLWIRSRDGAARRLTTHPAEDAQPAWSPDGRTILFASSRDHGDKIDRSVFFGYSIGADIWSVPALAGTPRKLVTDAYNPAWSPDGRRFAFDSARGGARRIWIANADGSDVRPLSSDDADLVSHIRPAWSPDGQWIAFERQTGSQSGGANIVVLAADGSREIVVTGDTHRNMAPAWADDDSIVFSSDRAGALNLWQIDIDTERLTVFGEPAQVTLGAGEDFDPAVAADGTLAYVTIRRLENLWQVDVDPASLEFGAQAEPLMRASWNDYAPALSLDNRRTLFSSDRTGNTDIWLLDDGEQPAQLTDQIGQDLQPVWSHDDSLIAFFSNTRGNDDIYVMPLAGAEPVPLTPADSNDINPYWSSDSSRLGFVSDRSGQSEVWVMNADGSDARQLTTIGTVGHTARWSPDDQWLLFTSTAGGDRDVWAVRADGSELRRLTDAPTQDAHGLWSADGRYVLYLSDHRTMFATDFDNGGHRELFDLGERIDFVHLSRDGSRFQFTRQRIEGDIWLID